MLHRVKQESDRPTYQAQVSLTETNKVPMMSCLKEGNGCYIQYLQRTSQTIVKRQALWSHLCYKVTEQPPPHPPLNLAGKAFIDCLRHLEVCCNFQK